MTATMKDFLARGLVAGAAGGVVGALFLQFVTEEKIAAAIGFEDAAGLGAGPGEADMVSRSAQTAGGMLATVVLGIVMGVVLSVVVALLHDKVRSRDESGRVLKLAGAAFAATALLPWLKYPANPPAVGNPDTIGQRTMAYLSLMLVSVLIVVVARWIWHALAARGLTRGAQFLLGGGAVVVMVSVAFLVFPANPDRVEPLNSEASPALTVSSRAPSVVLDAMLANARATGDETYRDPRDPSEALDLDTVASGSDLVGVPVAISTTKLVPETFTTLIWAFRLRSLVGLALMWAVVGGVLGLLLDRQAAAREAG